MLTAQITYIHASGNRTTQPLAVFPETAQDEIDAYTKWLLSSGEAKEIVQVYNPVN